MKQINELHELRESGREQGWEEKGQIRMECCAGQRGAMSPGNLYPELGGHLAPMAMLEHSLGIFGAIENSNISFSLPFIWVFWSLLLKWHQWRKGRHPRGQEIVRVW